MKKKIILINLTFILLLSVNLKAQNTIENITQLLTGNSYDFSFEKAGSYITTVYSGTNYFCSDGHFEAHGQHTEKTSFDDSYHNYSLSGKWWIDYDQNGNAQLNLYTNELKETSSFIIIKITDRQIFFSDGSRDLNAITCP